MKNYLSPAPRLHVTGHIDNERPRGRLELAGSDQTVTLAAENWRSILDRLGAGPTSRWKLFALRKVHVQLACAGIALELGKGSRLVARIGRNGRPALAGTCLGVGLLSKLWTRDMWGAR